MQRVYSKTFPRNTASFLYFLKLPYTISYSICSSCSSDNGDRSSISHFIRTAIFILFGHSKESVLFEDMTQYASVSLFLFSLLRQTLILTLPVTPSFHSQGHRDVLHFQGQLFYSCESTLLYLCYSYYNA